ncbi:hypothetical protein [Actinosynnema sp. NPDC020468]|uniref:hypothetical protein n=1 Tax=Actinosynnema sp. NPDC020468 TaxID=3154488 RepID=UPI003403CC6F
MTTPEKPTPDQPDRPHHDTTPLPADPPAVDRPEPRQAQPTEPPPVASAQEPVAPAVAPRRRFTGFVRHRATQLVAVGLLGLVLGAGITALVAHERDDDQAKVVQQDHRQGDDGRGPGRGGHHGGR